MPNGSLLIVKDLVRVVVENLCLNKKTVKNTRASNYSKHKNIVPWQNHLVLIKRVYSFSFRKSFAEEIILYFNSKPLVLVFFYMKFN